MFDFCKQTLVKTDRLIDYYTFYFIYEIEYALKLYIS